MSFVNSDATRKSSAARELNLLSIIFMAKLYFMPNEIRIVRYKTRHSLMISAADLLTVAKS